MTGDITPISQLGRRMPTAGRLRAGRKSDKGQPEKLTCWRATSHDEQAIRQIAAHYGGTPQQWNDSKVAEGQWEVLTETAEMPIVLPPDPLGNTPIYELWSGGGCQRRCDGVTCETTQQGPDGSEPCEVDCLCLAEGALACQPKTRLSVILPEVRFAGVWRIDTSSWNAARELPGMVDMIHTLQAQAGGIPRGAVALEQRLYKQKQADGKVKTLKPIVPVLRVMHSPDEIASGRASVGALHSGHDEPVGAPAIDAGAVDDDEVVDGEVVEPVDLEPLEKVLAQAAEAGIDVDGAAAREHAANSVEHRDAVIARLFDRIAALDEGGGS